ncbi:hypothetical protein [Legionella sp. WA2022007384]
MPIGVVSERLQFSANFQNLILEYQKIEEADSEVSIATTCQ